MNSTKEQEKTFTCHVCQCDEYHKDETFHIKRSGGEYGDVVSVSADEADFHICRWCSEQLARATGHRSHEDVSRKGGQAKSEKKTKAVRLNAKKPRFSKARFHNYLQRRVRKLKEKYGFTDSNGWNQIAESPELAKEYGEFETLASLRESIISEEITPFRKKEVSLHLRRLLKYYDEAAKRETDFLGEIIVGSIYAAQYVMTDIENNNL